MQPSRKSSRTLTPGDRGINVPQIIRHELRRHPVLSAEEETAVASAVWYAREEAWTLVLEDSLASARAAALLVALDNASTEAAVGGEVSASTAATRRTLLDAISTGDAAIVAKADKDDEVLREVIYRLPVTLAARARSCIVRLDAAVRKLERHNVMLVLHVIRCRFRGWLGGEDGRGAGAEFEVGDLLGFGMLGLRTAATRFDPRRGFRFSTFATHWVSHSIGRGIQDTRYRVRLPVHVQDKIGVVARVRTALLDEGKSATPEAIAAKVGSLSAVQVRSVLAAIDLNSGVSLHAKVRGYDGDDTELGDLVGDPSAESEDDLTRAMDEERRAAVLYEAMGDLRESERFVLEMRAGLDGSEPATLAEIGDAMGLSRQRASQIERNGLMALRRRIEARMC